MNMELERIKESRAETHFVNTVLFEAVDRLAARRGELLEDVDNIGWTVDATTGASDGSISRRISFEATYACLDRKNAGFIYQLVKSENIAEDFMNLSDFNRQKTIELLESDDIECLPEQAEGLLKLIEAYADPHNETVTELEYSSEYRVTCKADQVGENILIERSLMTYLDGTLISYIAIGNVEPNSDDEDDGETTDDEYESEEENDTNDEEELDEENLREIDLSTATIDDIAELREMLCMLGLADRKKTKRR